MFSPGFAGGLGCFVGGLGGFIYGAKVSLLFLVGGTTYGGTPTRT